MTVQLDKELMEKSKGGAFLNLVLDWWSARTRSLCATRIDLIDLFKLNKCRHNHSVIMSCYVVEEEEVNDAQLKAMGKTRRWYLSLPKANQVSSSTSFEIKTTSFPLGGSVVLDDLNALLRFFWRSSRWDERAMRRLAPLLTNRRCYTQPAVTHRLSSNNVQ